MVLVLRAQAICQSSLQAGQICAKACMVWCCTSCKQSSLLTAEYVPVLCLKYLCHGHLLAKPCRTVLADSALLLHVDSSNLLQDLE